MRGARGRHTAWGTDNLPIPSSNDPLIHCSITLVHSFIQQVIPEHLPWARLFSRCWELVDKTRPSWNLQSGGAISNTDIEMGVQCGLGGGIPLLNKVMPDYAEEVGSCRHLVRTCKTEGIQVQRS